jgi:hypothetical protein
LSPLLHLLKIVSRGVERLPHENLYRVKQECASLSLIDLAIELHDSFP